MSTPAELQAYRQQVLLGIADDLGRCVTCGNHHSPHSVTYPGSDGTRWEGTSWADPNDNHPLLTRLTWLSFGNTPSVVEWIREQAGSPDE